MLFNACLLDEIGKDVSPVVELDSLDVRKCLSGVVDPLFVDISVLLALLVDELVHVVGECHGDGQYSKAYEHRVAEQTVDVDQTGYHDQRDLESVVEQFEHLVDFVTGVLKNTDDFTLVEVFIGCAGEFHLFLE